MVAIRPKPGFIAGIGPENCPLEFRSLWEGLHSAIPLLLPREGNVQSTFLEADTIGVRAIYAGVGGTDYDFAVTEWGPGLEWISENTNRGIVISSSFDGATGPSYLNMRGDEPFTAAVLFKWDGTTGDERAILSQADNGGAGLRWRIANEASSANLLETSQAWFTNPITADHWYMFLLRSEADLTDAAQFDLLIYDYTDGTYVHDVRTTTSSHKGFDDPIQILGQSANDPANGMTLAGAWFWGRRLGAHASDTTAFEIAGEVGLFLSDPFGMFELGEPTTDAVTVVTATASGRAPVRSTAAVQRTVNATAQGRAPSRATAAITGTLSATASARAPTRATTAPTLTVGIVAAGRMAPRETLTAIAIQCLYPDGDILTAGWDTQPTPGQDLFSQIDEDPISDTDFIEEV